MRELCDLSIAVATHERLRLRDAGSELLLCADGAIITMTITHPDGTASTVKKRCNDGNWKYIRTDPADALVSAPALLGPALP